MQDAKLAAAPGDGDIEKAMVFFAPDGKSVVYGVWQSGGKIAAFHGDKKLGEWWHINGVSFAPDGRLAFLAQGDDIVELHVGPDKHEFPEGVAPVFSPDGKRVAFAAKKGEKWALHVDGKRGDEFDEVRDPAFTADGKTVCVVRNDHRWAVAVDGKPGDWFDLAGLISLHGPTIAFVANSGAKTDASGVFQGGGKCFAVVDGKKGPEFDIVRRAAFSPDGKTIAYAANLGGSLDYLGAGEGGKWHVVVNGEKGPAFDAVGEPAVTAAVAHFALDGNKLVACVGDRRVDIEGDAYDLALSPDGKTLAYRLRKESKWVLRAGDATSEEFDAAWPPAFSPDGKKISFGALKGRELWWKTLDIK